MNLTNRRVLAAVVALLVVASGAAAYTTIFTAGSGTSYEADSGLVVETTTDHGLDDANPFNGTDTVYINGASVTAAGEASVTIDQFTGDTTTLSGIDASLNTVTVDPGDKPHVDISGSVTALSWSTASLQDDEVAFTYSASDSGTVTMNGLAAGADWTAATSAGTLVDSGTANGNGEASIDVDAADGAEVILFTNHAPQASNLSPTDGAQLTEQETTFSVQVNDSEFGTAQDDEVQATLFVDGEQAYQENVTSNQTISTTEEFSTGGTFDYYWTLEDSYGENTITDVQTVSTPSQLNIFEEQNAETQVTTDGNATVTIYGTDQVYEREAENGTVDLVDLPIDEPLYVRATIPGYYSRTVYLESLYEQQRMYVLSENATATENRFTLEETPGYPEEETILRIQRPLTVNNTTTWQTIVGSEFGVNGFTVNLEEGVRYRLEIVGPNDNVASLGGYTATVSETVPLAPSRPSIAANPGDAPVSYDVQRKNGSLILGYADNDGGTSSVTVEIYERNNQSNHLEPNSTYTDTQEVAYAIDLSNETVNQSWVVEYHVQFEDGTSQTFRAISGRGGTITVPVELGAMWQQIIVAGLIVLFAGAFSVYNRSEGAFALALVGGLLLYIGWLDGITTWPAISVAVGIGVYSMLNNTT